MTQPVAEDADLEDVWQAMSPEERVEAFRQLPRGEAAEFFLARSTRTQALLLRAAPEGEQRALVRLLAPDDAVDLLQELEIDERPVILGMMDASTAREVRALLAYEEDEAGGLMNPRFVRLRPDITVEEAIAYARMQSRDRAETISYLYVLDAEQRLLGVLSFRDLFAASGGARVSDVMLSDVVAVDEHADQEEVAREMAALDVVALPVVDAARRMVGIVTVDDIVDVVQTEATEDIQKIGGSEALEAPYLQTGFLAMLRKRGGWLALLFVGQMFTATAMGAFEAELASALVLALFIPLVISSGGNSGSQATTLVVRAMALGELRARDWWRVARRELGVGLALGVMLGAVGVARVLVWDALFDAYGAHARLLAATVGLSVVGVVLWGTLTGSTLPFLMRRLGMDPASASAPFVATLVDVVGVVIYFSVARAILLGAVA